MWIKRGSKICLTLLLFWTFLEFNSQKHLGPLSVINVQSTSALPNWNIADSLPNPSVTAISCSTGSTCVAVGNNYSTASTDSGATWTEGSPAKSNLSNVGVMSCAGPTLCISLANTNNSGNYGYNSSYISNDEGNSWANLNIQASSATYQMTDVSCSNSSDCVIVGIITQYNVYFISGIIFATTDGGLTWTSSSLPSNTLPIFAVSCVSATNCTALASNQNSTSQILTSADGGLTWTVSKSLSFGLSRGFLKCPTVGVCYFGGALFVRPAARTP